MNRKEAETMPLFHKKSPPPFPYDPDTQEVAVRRSICTGEMTLGLIDKATGQFHELMLVTQRELDDIRRRLNLDEVKTIY